MLEQDVVASKFASQLWIPPRRPLCLRVLSLAIGSLCKRASAAFRSSPSRWSTILHPMTEGRQARNQQAERHAFLAGPCAGGSSWARLKKEDCAETT